MGCWNGTCALSNLSIQYGEDVVAILLIEDDPPRWEPSIRGGFVGTQRDCHPLAFPLFGKYDDGGALEEIAEDETTLALTQWLTATDRVALKKEGHCKYDLSNINSVVQAIERGLLSITVDGKVRGVGLMLIHRDLYEGVLNFARTDKYIQMEFEALTRYAARDCKQFQFMFKLAELRLSKAADEKISEDERDSLRDECEKELTFAEAMSLPEQARKAFIRNFRVSQYEKWCSLGIVSSDMRRNEDVFYFYLAMNALRKQYTMQGGAGSQDHNDEIIDSLQAATRELIHERKNRSED